MTFPCRVWIFLLMSSEPLGPRGSLSVTSRKERSTRAQAGRQAAQFYLALGLDDPIHGARVY